LFVELREELKQLWRIVVNNEMFFDKLARQPILGLIDE